MIKKRLTAESDEESESELSARETSVKFRRKRNNNKNIIFNVVNRSLSGYFNYSITKKSNIHTFNHISSDLRFCLKDIIPFCYLENQVFMGLSLCGNFLLSYKRCCESSETYDFNSGFKYELFFWIFKPHMPLHNYYKINLFDDHGVEDIKYVTMTQWKNDPRTLVIHGAGMMDDQHSFMTITRIPKLGCLGCKKLREIDTTDNLFKNYDLCIECNLTIHTKYFKAESTEKFQPKIHLNAPQYLIMCENSIIHTINVELDMQKTTDNVGRNFISHKYLSKPNATCEATTILTKTKKNNIDIEVGHANNNFHHTEPALKMVKTNSIVEQILADFSEFDECAAECVASTSTAETSKSNNINNYKSNNNTDSSSNNVEKKINDQVTKIGCDEHNKKIDTLNRSNDNEEQQQKNVQKTDNNGMSSSSRLLRKKSYAPSSPEIMEAAEKTYEFSEENEKCEKISIFRKRRLADKKYEFSEENTENIIPFNRTRNKISQRSQISMRRSSPHPSFLSPCSSPMSSSRHIMSPQGFRSPNYYTYRSSPTYNFLYSPPPRHLNMTRIGSMSPASEDIHKYFSDIMNRMNDGRIEMGNDSSHDDFNKIISNKSDIPIFSKKIVNHYIEEDDANSVGKHSNSEDDCISPGYHLSLPMEVHGGCYAKMQVVSKISLNRLKGHPRVTITQNSFDVETFSIHIANLLCKKNDKKYGILFDLAFEIIHVCPLSQNVLIALCLQFTASDYDRLSQCLNCSNDSTSNCFLHRRLYETTVLFSWKMTNDEWKILDSGQLKQLSTQMKISHPIRGNRQEMLIRKLQRFIRRVFGKDRSFLDKYDHLRILDCNEDKSKDSITDYKNGVEFYRRQPYDSPSSISSLSSNSSASNSSNSSAESCDE